VAVCESGIENSRQVEALRDLKYDAVLVGERIMRARHPGHEVRELLHG
jgi:indole-3-glycerol phosphate synthase